MTQTKTEAPLTDAEIKAKLIAWRRDPVLYVKERLGITNLWKGELDMLRALPRAIWERKPLVVASGHALGKDFTISGSASLWFYECFGPCKVAMTGPTERQVIDIMWSELKSRYEHRPLRDEMGRMTTGRLEYGPDHFITAFTTKESKEQQGKFQGLHSQRVMVIVSEAQAVEDAIFDQIEAITTSAVVLICFLGNPLTNTGRFAKAIDDTTNNIVIHLDCYESPNVIESREVVPGLVTKEWVEDKERKWNSDKTGKDPRYMARVRGLKPDTSIDTVISRELYQSCIGRALSWWSGKYCSIGVDPALTGTDDMVISIMESGRLIGEEIMPKCEAPQACSFMAVAQRKYFPDGCTMVVDCDGLGAPIAQFYRTMKLDNVDLVEFHGSSTDRELVSLEFHNQRAEASFYAKQRMEQGHVALDANEEALEEGTSEKYFMNTRGKLQIEDKEDIKDRIGRSPGRWDARKLAIWGFKTAQKIRKKDAWRETRGALSIASGLSAMSA